MESIIIVTGEELLRGKTLDYNSYWIAKRLTGLGIDIRRKSTVPDSRAAIQHTIQAALDREMDLIVTVGGLGPTPKDATLKAVAEAIGGKLELHKQALELVRKNYQRFYQLGFVDSPEMTEARKKMARLPEGATPLKNEIGVAPAVKTPYKDTSILSLPGVPSEMMYTLEQAIPFLSARQEAGVVRTKELYIEERDESRIAQVFEEIMEELEGLEIKSYPTGFGKEMKMRVIAISRAKTVAKAEKKLENAISFLKKRLRRG